MPTFEIQVILTIITLEYECVTHFAILSLHRTQEEQENTAGVAINVYAAI